MKNNKHAIVNQEINTLYHRVATVIHEARSDVIKTIDTAMVKAYWKIGKYIVEEEQQGMARASYGKELLKNLAERLHQEFGRGFSISTLEDIRKFYITYSNITEYGIGHAVSDQFTKDSSIPHALRGEFTAGSSISHAVRGQSLENEFNPKLSWTHYRILMRVSRLEARQFYEITKCASF